MQLLIDALRLKCRQLSQAIEIGEDDLVFALDRQIEPLIRNVIRSEPRSEEEQLEQVKVVYELLSQDGADLDSVTDKATVMMLLLDRMFRRRANEMPTPRPVSPKAVSADFEDDIELTQALLDQLPDGVLLVGRDMRLLFANETFCASHGVKPLDCIGARLCQFLGGAPELADITERARQVFDTGLAPPTLRCQTASYDFKPFEIRGGRSVAVMILIRAVQAGAA